MKELDVIKHARGYMDMLSRGYNPITKEKYNHNSDINNERLLKCFSFVTEILDRVISEETQKETEVSKNQERLDSNSNNVKSQEPLNNLSVPTLNEQLLYDPNSLVSDTIEGKEVVKTLIEKGYLKQGFSTNNKSK